ncbi:MAG TPA: site-2 protease family protein [Sumerlaeia bacterium]|nr:site-2 protease family protein [Sumerlaeia bacterium]
MLEIWLDRLLGVLGAVFLFGFAVLVHELGHFIMARLCGVGVRKFAIGFGPKIWAATRGGTEYSIRWLPFGGFVALKGMIEGLDEESDACEKQGSAQDTDREKNETDPSLRAGTNAGRDNETSRRESLDRGAKTSPKGSMNVTEDLDALRNKAPLVRMAVFGAGVACNFLSAILFMAILLWYGRLVPVDLPNVMGEISEDSPWYEAGWRSGDKIVRVDPAHRPPGPASAQEPDRQPSSPSTRKEISTERDVMEAIGSFLPPPPRFKTWDYLRKRLLGAADPPTSVALRITAERNGKELILPWSTALHKADRFERHFTTAPYIGAVYPNSPAYRARLVKAPYTEGESIRPYPTWEEMKPCPLQADDLILAVDHQPVATWNEMARLLQAHPNETVTLTLQRGRGPRPGETKETLLLATVLERADEDPKRGRLGVQSGELFRKDRERLPLFQAIAKAPLETLVYADLVLFRTIEFFAVQSGREIKRNLGGPMAIVIHAYKSAQQGLINYLSLFIYISIVLAILNLLPIPVLDGGYILITVVEAAIRRPIPHKVLASVLTAFTVLFVFLFAFLIYNDVMNWVFKL